MFIKVKLLSGIPEPLVYRIPASWQSCPSTGSLVKVPLRNTVVPALVLELLEESPAVTFAIRDIESTQQFPVDPLYFEFIKKLGHYYQLDPITFLRRIQAFFKHDPETVFVAPEQTDNAQTVVLTDEQQRVVDYLAPHITTPQFCPTVLHGVTGSGKTQVYKKLIVHACAQGKTSILLVPEVTLAVQFEQLLRAQCAGTVAIVSFHSATNAQDRKLLWNNLLAQKPHLIIGVHLPILLPIANLGLIIVDEEHEIGYQEKKHPKINTKDAAIWRAQLHGIPLVLGSATPSIATLHNVKTRGWKLFTLRKRFAGEFPRIEFVKLLDKKQRKNFWFSTQLLNAIGKQLAKKEQTILFLNRRGISFFVQCKGCSFVFTCRSCSVSLTLHSNDLLRCHYCGHKEQHPAHCPACNEQKFIKKGVGTQQIVTILQKLFPTARIARADVDVTINRTQWQTTVSAFYRQEIDILVGTQTITKGYHFPHVTLVGIIWADINLHFPYYNAQEVTLQQLIQVAGRAGRQHPNSTVIVQAMDHHPVFEYVNEVDYLKFYENEVLQRQQVGYPPFIRFAEIELKHSKEEQVEIDAQSVAQALSKFPAITVLGPTQPPVAKIKKIFSRKIFVKSQSFDAIVNAYQKVNATRHKSSLFLTPNPV